MKGAPLKLRLLVKEGDGDGIIYKGSLDMPARTFFGHAVLQFQNPIDYSWHPVEVVVEEKD